VQWLDDHVAGPADRLGNVVEPHVAKSIKPPGTHRISPSESALQN
jgi:hypothetical protein